ncbi:MAG: hypothetical protein L6R42_006728 [Xanthoria sp. 1 TBL-2021]|nr:MAG: hypothetical protein L6R42_006728 [Xanthoria sp. 1 TBL-2021]
MFKILGYEHGMQKGNGKSKDGWTRKRPGQKSGSDDYQAPLRKGSVRASQRDQPPPGYFPQEDVRFFDHPGQLQHQQDPRFDDHPAQFQQQDPRFSNHPSRLQQQDSRLIDRAVQLQQQDPRFDDHPAQFQQQDARFSNHPSRLQQQNPYFIDQAAPILKSSAHPSRRQTVHYQPDDRERSMHPDDPVREADLRRSANHASKFGAPIQAMGPPQDPHQGRSVHHPNRRSEQPIQRSERGSQRLAPIYEGRERHSRDVFAGSHRDGACHPSRADQGGRQYTVHDDFAKAPGHTGSARTGGAKQKAMLYGAKKEVTLADF